MCASSSDVATTATADGASFIILQPADGTKDHASASLVKQVIDGARSGLQIPLIAASEAVAPTELPAWVSAGLDGVYGSLEGLTALSGTSQSPSEGLSSISATLSAVSAQLSTAEADTAPTPAAQTKDTPSPSSGLLSGLLGEKTPLDALITREKECLTETIEFLETAVPDMGETRLLKDALVGLEEPFLLVVVGEFNSGKSTVINALLGAKYLEEGILPTTNEISILKHADDKEKTEKVRTSTYR